MLATPPGFTPLASNANITAAGGAAKKRGITSQRRAVQNRKKEAKLDQWLLNPNAGVSKARYPQSVTCVEYVADVEAAGAAAWERKIGARSPGESIF